MHRCRGPNSQVTSQVSRYQLSINTWYNYYAAQLHKPKKNHWRSSACLAKYGNLLKMGSQTTN